MLGDFFCFIACYTSSMNITVRALQFEDFSDWLPLWIQNNQGQNNEAVTAQTWQRITDTRENVFALGAFEKDKMVGILHYILHPTTGHLSHACYMQDLFTDPNKRNKGIAKKMLQALHKEHKKQKWARIYWVAENDNVAAQTLYKEFGAKLDFSFHALI